LDPMCGLAVFAHGVFPLCLRNILGPRLNVLSLIKLYLS